MADDDDFNDYLNAFEFVTHLPAEMRKCRGGRSHNFIDGEQLFGDVNHGIVHTETRCARGCKVIKVEDFDRKRGYYVKPPHYRYPPAYLVKSKEDGPVHPTDLAAASRLIHYYERKGLPMPKPARSQRRNAS